MSDTFRKFIISLTFPGLFICLLFLTGCESVPNPYLDLSGLDGYQISMSSTIEGETPAYSEYRVLDIKNSYSSMLFGMVQLKEFELEPVLKSQLGNEKKISHLEIDTYSDVWQSTLKLCSIYLYEPRTIRVTGKVWLEN
jgi:hypothetical protein